MLPPHCSHKLQASNLTTFFPLKGYYDAAVDSQLMRNPGMPMVLYQMAEYIGEAHMRAVTPGNITEGFKNFPLQGFCL
jgi:hypothetical protein